MANGLAIIFQESTCFIEYAILDGEIEYITNFGDTFVIHDVKLSSAEWSSNLVFDNLDFGAVTNNIFAVLDLADATDINTN